jgi:hypothetical protein
VNRATAKLALALALAVLPLGSAAAPATASGDVDPVQAWVDTAMSAEPGGIQVAPGVVEWQGGAAVLTVGAVDSARAVGSCATGSICVYASGSLQGAKLAVASCSTFSTAGLGAVVKSMVNAREKGYARGYNSADGLLTTLAPGVSLNNAPAGLVKVVCA